VLLALAVPIVLAIFPRRSKGAGRDRPALSPAVLAIGGLVGIGLAVTPGLGGHASTSSLVPVALTAAVVHMLGMGIWLGGLVALLVTLLPASASDVADDVRDASSALDRFSRLALGCVVVLVASGTVRAWQEVGSVSALTSTDYGRLLLVKVGAVAVLIAVAAVTRDALRSFRAAETPVLVPVTAGVGAAAAPEEVMTPEEERAWARGRLRRGVLVELAFAVVVLCITSLLVNTAPARAEEAKPYAATITSTEGAYRFDVIVAPARTGPNDVHVTAISAGGGPRDAITAEVELALPAKDIAPISLPLRRLGPGHYFSPGFEIPLDGEWLLTIRMLVSETQSVSASTTVTIR